jgi:glucose-1-phosphate thymidylyltransferase
VACLEAIVYRRGRISEEKMRELAKPMIKNQYGQYLLKIIDEKKQELDSDTFRDNGVM